MRFAEKVRLFFEDLFHSSLIRRLEGDLVQLRMDMQTLRQEKDIVISELRSEKTFLNAKVGMYEVNVNRRVGIDPSAKNPEKPSFLNFNSPPMKSSWQLQVEEHDRKNAELDAAEAAAAAKKAAANG